VNIGDLYFSFRGSSKQLELDAAQAGDRAGKTLGSRLKRALSAENVGTAIGAGIGGIAVAALKLADKYDRAMDTIRIGTGATGEALADLEKSFQSVAGEVPDDIDLVSQVIADLNTRTGQTGEGLETLAKQILDLSRLTRTDAATNVAALTRLYGDWTVATEDQAAANDALFRASQATGIGIDKLSESLVQFGAPLRNIGFDIAESTALLAKWEKEGVNTELALGGLKIALGNFAKQGIDAKEGLADLVAQIEEVGPGAEAMALGVTAFGSRAGPDMTAAILEGRFAIEEYVDVVENGEETIASATEATQGFGEQFAKLKNQVAVAVGPIVKDFAGIAEGLGNAVYLLPALGGLLGRGIGKAWTKAGGPAIKAIIAATGAAAGLAYRAAAAAGGALATALQSVWLAMGAPGSKVITAAIASGRAAGLAMAAAAAAAVVAIAFVVDSSQAEGVEHRIEELEREIERFNRDNLEAQAEFATAGTTYGDILRGMEVSLEALLGGHVELADAFRDGTISLEEFETALDAVDAVADDATESLTGTGEAAGDVVPPMDEAATKASLFAEALRALKPSAVNAIGGMKGLRTEADAADARWKTLIDKPGRYANRLQWLNDRIEVWEARKERANKQRNAKAEALADERLLDLTTERDSIQEVVDRTDALADALEAVDDVDPTIKVDSSQVLTAKERAMALWGILKNVGGSTRLLNMRDDRPQEGDGATGAIVNRPTLALIGERGPEAVVPLSETSGNGPLPTGGPQVVEHRHTITAEGARNLAASGYDESAVARLLRQATSSAGISYSGAR
jgi:cell division protein FtsL